MDVDCVMLPSEFNINAKTEGITHEIMIPEHLLHLILHLPNEADLSNAKEIINIQNDYGDDYAMHLLVMPLKHSSVNTRCHKPT